MLSSIIWETAKPSRESGIEEEVWKQEGSLEAWREFGSREGVWKHGGRLEARRECREASGEHGNNLC